MMRRLTFGVLMAAASVSCSGDAELLPPIASGTYQLSSVSGRGASTGTITLGASGEAERRVRYTDARGVVSPEYVAIGTYTRASNSRLVFQLRENGGNSALVFTFIAVVSGNALTIEFVDPADGPNIVETYRRE